MNLPRTTKFCLGLIAAVAAIGLMTAPAMATATPENIAVTYDGSVPNGTITVGSTVITEGTYNFQYPGPLTVIATDVSTSATFSLNAEPEDPEALYIDTSVLPSGIYTLSFDNLGDNTGAADILFTLTPNLYVGPSLTSLSPAYALAGSPSITLTAIGTGYVDGDTIDWNGTPLTTTFVSATSLTATVPAGDLTTAGTANVTVVDTNSVSSPTVTFNIDALPTLSAISPNRALVGAPATTITATGTNFVSGAAIAWNGTPLTTTFVSATSLTATIPIGDLATAGAASVTVVNPDAGISNAKSFAIDSLPVLTLISPEQAVVGSPATTITATGAGFVSGAVVKWNGASLATTFVNATKLTALIPVGDLNTTGLYPITVVNPDTGTSGTLYFIVTHVPPTLTRITPNSAAAGSPTITLTATGTGFAAQDKVEWNSAQLATTFVNATTLTAIVPAADLVTVGTASVKVSYLSDEPTIRHAMTPPTATTAALTFTIDAKPAITTISPSSARLNSPATSVTIHGSGFLTGAVVKWNGAALATTYVSAVKLTAIIPPTDLTVLGVFPITVANTDHGISNSVSFTVVKLLPVITTINPGKVTAGDDATQVTITGADFDTTAKVSFNGGAAITPDTIESATQLKVTLPEADLVRAGSYPITVTTDGGISTPVAFLVDPIYSFGAPGLKMISTPYDTTGQTVTPTTIGWIDSVSGAETNLTSLGIVDWTGAAYATPTSGLKLGVGYWVRVPSLNDGGGKPENLSLLIKGTPATLGTSFKIVLKPGWNLIGDALPQSVPLASLSVLTSSGTLTYLKAAQNGIVGTEFYTFDSTQSSVYADQSITQSGTALQPYAGYWILDLAPCSLVFPVAQ